MEVKHDIFTVTMPEGAGCTLRKLKEDGFVSEYEFHFVWNQEHAAANAGFDVAWEDMVPGILYKWDSRCALAKDLSPH